MRQFGETGYPRACQANRYRRLRRHDAVVAICGRLVLQRWSDSRAVKFLVPIVNENFGEGDWTKEIENALAHARGRESVRLGAMRGRPWQ